MGVRFGVNQLFCFCLRWDLQLDQAANQERIGKRDLPSHDAIGRAEAKWLSKMRGTIGYQSE